jgi:hypothetical protein
MISKKNIELAAAALLIMVASFVVPAQTTEFTYQGRLLSGGIAAAGPHDFVFALYDAVEEGNQLGPFQVLNNVNVNNGVFSVRMDFGNQFTGPNRYLEIRVRQIGEPNYTVLGPRQAITSAPYAIKSLNAANAEIAADAVSVGGVPAENLTQNDDPRLSDARPPTAGSGAYIQNSVTPQAESNFNVSGTGSANILNAETNYSLRGISLIRSFTSSLSVGENAGPVNGIGRSAFFGTSSGSATTTGIDNSFFGNASGQMNTTGSANSFVGSRAGMNNITGSSNSFFGVQSGFSNSSGIANAFFGAFSGVQNTTGGDNAFFGMFAGNSNTTASANSFFGTESGRLNTTADGNSFFGRSSGRSTTSGSYNSMFGAYAGESNTTGESNAFFGANSGSSNTFGGNNSFFGAISGRLNTSGFFNAFFGTASGNRNSTGSNNAFFGASSGSVNSTGRFNSFFGSQSGLNNTTGESNTFVGYTAGPTNTNGTNNTLLGSNTNVGSFGLTFATAIGSGAMVSTSNTIALGRPTGADQVIIPGNLIVNGTTTIANLNAQFLGGIPANQYVVTTDSRLSDARTPTPGSPSYIQNSTALQSVSNFNISGTGRANFLRATSRLGVGSDDPDNPLTVTGIGTGSGGVGTVPEVVARFRRTGTHSTAISLDAGASNLGSIVYFAQQGVAQWAIRNTGTGVFQIARHAGSPTQVSLSIATTGQVAIPILGTSGGTSLCRNSSLQISNCSSSAQYKNNIVRFSSGLDLIKRLNPVSFNWREGGMADLGLVAEDVADVEPLLTTLNDNGEIEGVKYDRVGVVLVNAVKEQQQMIDAQRETIRRLENSVETLKQIVCGLNLRADICKPQH